MDCDFFALALSLAIIFIFFFMYQFYYYRDRYLLFWSLGCLLQMSGYYLGFRYNFITPRVYAASIILLSWMLLITASFFITLGTLGFVDKKPPRWFWAVFGVGLAVGFLYPRYPGTLILRAVLELFSAAGTFASGALMIAYLDSRVKSKYLTGTALMLWGLYFSGYCFYLFIAAKVPIATFRNPSAGFITAIIGTLSALGVLIAYFQKKALLESLHSDYVHGLSHELKTKLMVIHNYTQLMLEGIYPKGSLESSINTVYDEVGRLESRVRNLVVYNKMESWSGQQQGCVQIDLAELICQSIEGFRWKRPELAWRTDLFELFLAGDREQWRAVIENILDNQTRYAASAIDISLYETNGGGTYILRVSNDGPPIEAGILETLFEPYHEGSKGGFGLGMVIVKSILERHQAKIRVENENFGAAYYIELAGKKTLGC